MYSAKVNIPAPPASNFAGRAGGDPSLRRLAEDAEREGHSHPVHRPGRNPDRTGYFMALGNGQLFTVGTATSPGDLSKDHSAAKIVGIASTPTGHGYLLVGADGGIFCFGTAPYLVGSGNVQKGSIPPLQNIITAPIVGAAG